MIESCRGRILLATDSLDIGGAERHVVDLALALSDRQYRVDVACASAGALEPELHEVGIPVHVVAPRPVKRRLSPAYAWGLGRLVRKGQFNLVHAHVYSSSAAAVLACAGTGIPIVLTAHTECRWQGPGARWVSRRVYPRAGSVIAVSHGVAQHMIAGYSVPPDRVCVVPNAVSPRGTVAVGEARALRARWGGGPLIGVVARLWPEKGVDTFLEAAARVTEHVPEARYLVVGDGPLRRTLQDRARRLGLDRRVRFLGARSDARRLMPAFDVLAVPSRSEGGPLVVLEAMECGLPVVATRVGSIPRQIRHGREGLLVAPDDPAALARALIGLLREPALAWELGECARRRVRREFPYEGMVEAVLEQYDRVMARPARATSSDSRKGRTRDGETVPGGRVANGAPRSRHIPHRNESIERAFPPASD